LEKLTKYNWNIYAAPVFDVIDIILYIDKGNSEKKKVKDFKCALNT